MTAMVRAIIIVLLMLGAGHQCSIASEPTAQDKKQPFPLQELRALAQAYSLIKQNYYAPVDDRTLFIGALEGMVAKLDSHSEVMPSNAYRRFLQESVGEYAGIGIELAEETSGFSVRKVYANTPAARGGVRAGDRLVAIDGETLTEKNIDAVVSLLIGRKGSALQLTWQRAGKTYSKTLRREIILVPSVRFSVLAKDYGYLRIESFNQRTREEVSRALHQVQKGQQLQGLLIDLRHNPGGTMAEAIALADDFLERGVIVVTHKQGDAERQLHHADAALAVAAIPLVLLVDGQTASAAEIFTAALKDNGKARVVGQRTYGKGSIQTIYEINDELALKITTEHYLSPKGNAIEGHGITPHVKLPASHFEATFLEGNNLLADPDIKAAYNELIKM